ncbi:hypothetical protein 8P_062 [Pseudomonas phage 8P]|nr:hypothetical protein 8P_062 [Pseudomonas phage 8P]
MTKPRIDSIRMTYRTEPPRKKPQAGDIRVIKGKTMIRQQVRHNGMYVVSGGRPVWEWVEKGGERDRTARQEVKTL